MTDNITLPRAAGKTIRKALTRRERYLFPTEQAALAALEAALAEQDAIARAVEAAVKECVTICEQQRVKILKNPADPSWTEHLAEVQSEMKQRFGVEMGYPALAEQEQKQKPATVEWLLKWYMACDYRPLSNVWHYYCAGWRHAERFHGIGGSK